MHLSRTFVFVFSGNEKSMFFFSMSCVIQSIIIENDFTMLQLFIRVDGEPSEMVFFDFCEIMMLVVVCD